MKMKHTLPSHTQELGQDFRQEEAGFQRGQGHPSKNGPTYINLHCLRGPIYQNKIRKKSVPSRRVMAPVGPPLATPLRVPTYSKILTDVNLVRIPYKGLVVKIIFSGNERKFLKFLRNGCRVKMVIT